MPQLSFHDSASAFAIITTTTGHCGNFKSRRYAVGSPEVAGRMDRPIECRFGSVDSRKESKRPPLQHGNTLGSPRGPEGAQKIS